MRGTTLRRHGLCVAAAAALATVGLADTEWDARFGLRATGSRPLVRVGLGDAVQVEFSRGKVKVKQSEDGRWRETAGGEVAAWKAGAEPRPVLIKFRARTSAVFVAGVRVVRWYGTVLPDAEPVLLEQRDAAAEGWAVQEIAPVAFADDFTPLAGTPAEDPGDAAQRPSGSWEALSGEWGYGSRRDGLIARDRGPLGAAWYAGRGQPGLCVTGYEFWDQYSASLTARAEAETAFGVAFAVQDAANYGVLRLWPSDGDAGAAALVAVRDGKEEALAKATLDCRPGQWHGLRVELGSGAVCGSVNGERLLHAPWRGVDSGRVGLYLDGVGGAEFDDVEVQAVSLWGADWRDPLAGDWSGSLRGAKLTEAGCRLRSGARLSARGGSWREYEATAWLQPGSRPAGLLLSEESGDGGVEFGLARRRGGASWRLAGKGSWAKRLDASGEVGAAGGEARLSARMRAGRAEFCVDGRPVAVHYGSATVPGRVGLFASGTATVGQFLCRAPVDRHRAVVCESDGSNMRVPGVQDGYTLAVVGDLWRPVGKWARVAASGDPRIRLTPGGGESGLWYLDPCPGDVFVSARLISAEAGGALRLRICGRPGDSASGYSLRVARSEGDGPATLQIMRGAEALAEAAAPAPPGARITLAREGARVLAEIDGEIVLSAADPEPLESGHAAVCAEGAAAVVDDLQVGQLTGRVYRFERPEPDWRPSLGEWLEHSGMACIPFDHWISALGKPVALSWNRHTLWPDFEMRCQISEYTLGYESGAHQHFPYHDVDLVLCGRQPERDSGYRFVIGAEGGQLVRLFRRGVLVTQSNDARFQISMGAHCNTPRAMDICVRRVGGKITLLLQRELALEYEDPEPLPPGQVALGCEGCSVNFSDFVMAAERTWQGE